MKNFIQTKFEDYNPGVVCQKVLITLLLVRSQGIVIYKFFQRAVHYIIYYWQFTQSRSQQYHGPSQNQRRMLSLRCCLGAKRVLLFMIERVFWLMEEVWLMHISAYCKQCTIRRRKKAKGQRKFVSVFLVLWENVIFISQYIKNLIISC